MNSSSRSFFLANQLIGGRKKQKIVLDRAYEEVPKILGDFKAPELPEYTEKDLARVVKEAEDELLSRNKKFFNPVPIPKKYGILKTMKSNRR